MEQDSIKRGIQADKDLKTHDLEIMIIFYLGSLMQEHQDRFSICKYVIRGGVSIFNILLINLLFLIK